MKIENIILYHLLKNETYMKRVIPFIEDKYFSEQHERIIFVTIRDFIVEYNSSPSFNTVLSNIKKLSLSEAERDSIRALIVYFREFNDEEFNTEWLIDETEKWVKEKALYHAMMESISIIDDPKNNKNKGMIPEIITTALSVSFDSSVGHDYLEDSDKRFDSYHKKEDKTPFDLKMFNVITGEGVPNKTLNIVCAQTGVGKTIFLCHLSASYLSMGKNVLYITLEMAEERIAERIDANLLSIPLENMSCTSKEAYEKKMNSIRSKYTGKLIIKEYPTSCLSVLNIKHLLQELRLKKKFVPEIIIVDYLNIASSSRVKVSVGDSYNYVKMIAEEMRGLAVEQNIVLWSATQLNRGGYDNTDVGITNIADSIGLPNTCDFMFVLIQPENLAQMNQVMVKQLKNRYRDVTKNKTFIVGLDKSYMRFHDISNESIDNNPTQNFNNTNIPSEPVNNSNWKDRFKDWEDII